MCNKCGFLISGCVLALGLSAAWPGESEPVEVVTRDLPIGGVRTKGRWTYYGGMPHLGRIRLSRDGASVWVATNKGVMRLEIGGERLTRYSALDGLADSFTGDLAVGAEGSVWAATYGGLSRLTGAGWTSWGRRDGLRAIRLQRVTVDQDGEPWIGGMDGTDPVISHHDSGRWIHYSREGDGLPAAEVDLLYAGPGDKVWALLRSGRDVARHRAATGATSYSLACFSADGTWALTPLPKHLISYTRSQPINALVGGPSGRLLAATPLGLFAWDGEKWLRYGVQQGLPDETVWALCPGPAGRVWGLTSRGVFSFDGTSASVEVRFPAKLAPLCEQSRTLAVGADGDVWITAPAPPILLLHGEKTKWTVYLPELDGPVGSQGLGVHTVLKDTAGRYYFGAAGRSGGLTRFDDQGWRVLRTGNVLGVSLDKNDKLWVVDGSVLSYSGEKWTDESHALGLYGTARAIGSDRRRALWIAGDRELIEWDGVKVVKHAGDPTPFAAPFAGIASGPAGHLWVRCAQGVAQWKGERSWSFAGKATGAPGLRGSSIAVGRRGEVYIGGPWGAAKYDGAAWTQYTAMAAETYEALPVLPGLAVNAISVDRQGAVWFGTDEAGVAVFDGRSWARLSTSEGLASNSVWSIFEDEESFWFGTIAGVSRYRKE